MSGDDTYPLIEKVAKAFGTYEKNKPGNEQTDDVPSWDDYFHAVAQTVALRSKDQRKVGAVIVSGEGNVILSTGFNGFARGIRETKSRTAEDEKLVWVTHAEANAIFNAARHGISLVGSTIYVTLYPCSQCAQAIVQAGVKRVFTYGTYWIKLDPSNRWEIAMDLFAEAHISVDAPQIRRKDKVLWEADKRREKEPESKQSRPPSIPPSSMTPTGTE